MKDNFAQTERTTLKRLPKRAVLDRQTVYEILDEGFVCHVGFAVDGGPVVIPTGYGRSGDSLFIHGSAASRMLRTLAGNIEVCVTVTLIDGLVLARSAFHHSMNYRSVVIFGTASVVQETTEKREALRAISEHIIPQRWNDVREPNENELKATLVLRLPLLEVSAKVRTGPPLDDETDYQLSTWAGEVPLRLIAQIPIPDPRLPQRVPLPSYIRRYIRGTEKVLQSVAPLGAAAISAWSSNSLEEKKQETAPIQVRMATPEDAALIASILESAFIEYRSSYTDEGFAATAITKDKVEVRMNEGPMWVALQHGVIVGTVAAISRDKALHVRGMGIVPAARGKKIGELLLKHVENFAASRGFRRMTLNTTPFLRRAIRLYERYGFERSGEGPFDLFGTPLFSMVKDLNQTVQEPES